MRPIYYLPTSKSIEECKLALGEGAELFRFFEDELGRVYMVCIWYEMKSSQITALEKASEILDEGYAVQNTPIRDIPPYGVAVGGFLWIAHRKGHDHFIFDLEDKGVTLNWADASKFLVTPQSLNVRKFVLVGEGNALRNTRRWIKRQLTDGHKEFQLRKLEEVRKRANKYQFSLLVVVDNGIVIDLSKTIPEIIDRRNAPPSVLVQLLHEYTVVGVQGTCTSVKTPTPLVSVLNQVHTFVNEEVF
ncbi:hypothetical protein PHABIO_405 [Pseudomonas phage Phabio]|uniref:Uncharacterized protein n=1 Tax=Pseudomonas phage Phabio TaxID=2006668 RepID=A0A1Y0SZD2_9CAUD|nr:hypothetical protein MZD05_gp405 [Pseudomonas phage Phabio]ARV77036.1 hypothetical protein PHABIO_405 [Pseudomonas phage Phabio]